MYLKTKNGITIIALIITVVIMMLIAGVSIHYGLDIARSAKLEDIKTDMLSIQAKAKIILEENTFKETDLVGSQISNQDAEKIGVTNSNKLLKWSEVDLLNQGLNTIKGDKYIVDYNNNCEVYYIDGYNGEYSLTALQSM